MKLLTILLFVVFPFGQLVPHANDILIGVIGGIGIIRGIRKIPQSIAYWIIAAGISLALNFHFIGGLYLLRWVAYFGIYLFLLDFKNPKFLFKGFKIVSLVIAIAGIAQYLLLPDTTFLAVSNWDDHSFRLISTFFDPGFTGIILTLGILGNFGNFGIIFTAMMLTYSRASYLAYLVGISGLYFYKKSIKLFLGLFLVFIIAVYLLPRSFGESTNLSRENSIWSRINNWKQAITVWQKAPIFGVGFGNYRLYSGASEASHAGAGSDSSILTVLATTGIVGLLAYLYLLKNIFSLGGALFKISFLAVFAHSWFNNTLFYPWVMEWLWILLALSRWNSQPDLLPRLSLSDRRLADLKHN